MFNNRTSSNDTFQILSKHSPNTFGASNKNASKLQFRNGKLKGQFHRIQFLTKRCLLCLHQKSEILHYPNTDEQLNKWSKLITKCHHANKHLLCNYKPNNRKHHKESLATNLVNSWRLVSVKFMRDIEEIITLCGFQLSPSSLMGKLRMNAISADFRMVHLKTHGHTCLWVISSPGDCVKELYFAQGHGVLFK